MHRFLQVLAIYARFKEDQLNGGPFGTRGCHSISLNPLLSKKYAHIGSSWEPICQIRLKNEWFLVLGRLEVILDAIKSSHITHRVYVDIFVI